MFQSDYNAALSETLAKNSVLSKILKHGTNDRIKDTDEHIF